MAEKTKPRKVQFIVTATLPKGMTVAQARHAYWNGGFNGENPGRYDTVSVDVDEYFDDFKTGRTMKVRLGKAVMVRAHG